MCFPKHRLLKEKWEKCIKNALLFRLYSHRFYCRNVLFIKITLLAP